MRNNAKMPARKETQPLAAEQPRRTPRKARFDTSPYLFILPFVLFCLALLLYPVVYSLTLSFRQATVDTFVGGDMPFNGLTQYQAAVADPVFWRAVVNTVLFAFFSILFQFSIGFLLALFFQASFPLKNFCLAALLIPWVSPVLTAANISKGLLNKIGPINQIFHIIGLGPFPCWQIPRMHFRPRSWRTSGSDFPSILSFCTQGCAASQSRSMRRRKLTERTSGSAWHTSRCRC